MVHGKLVFKIWDTRGADLTGVFFDWADKREGIVNNFKITSNDTVPLGPLVTGNDSVVNLGGGVDMNGLVSKADAFDAGFRVGLSGGAVAGGKADLFPSVSFTMSSKDGTALDFKALEGLTLGVREQSVPVNGQPAGSAKIMETIDAITTAKNDIVTLTENMIKTTNVLTNDLLTTATKAGILTWGIVASDGTATKAFPIGTAVDIGFGATATMYADGRLVVDASGSDAMYKDQVANFTFFYTATYDTGDMKSTSSAQVLVTITGLDDALTFKGGALSADEGNVTHATFAAKDPDMGETEKAFISDIAVNAATLGGTYLDKIRELQASLDQTKETAAEQAAYLQMLVDEAQGNYGKAEAYLARSIAAVDGYADTYFQSFTDAVTTAEQQLARAIANVNNYRQYYDEVVTEAEANLSQAIANVDASIAAGITSGPEFDSLVYYATVIDSEDGITTAPEMLQEAQLALDSFLSSKKYSNMVYYATVIAPAALQDAQHALEAAKAEGVVYGDLYDKLVYTATVIAPAVIQEAQSMLDKASANLITSAAAFNDQINTLAAEIVAAQTVHFVAGDTFTLASGATFMIDAHGNSTLDASGATHLAQGEHAPLTDMLVTWTGAHGETAADYVIADVIGINNAPTAADINLVAADGTVRGNINNWRDLGTDPDNDHVLSIASIAGHDVNLAKITGSLVLDIAGGSLKILEDGSYELTLAANADGTMPHNLDPISYTIKDEYGLTDDATINVFNNTRPDAVDDYVGGINLLDSNNHSVSTAFHVGVNDFDADGDSLAFALARGATSGAWLGPAVGDMFSYDTNGILMNMLNVFGKSPGTYAKMINFNSYNPLATRYTPGDGTVTDTLRDGTVVTYNISEGFHSYANITTYNESKLAGAIYSILGTATRGTYNAETHTINDSFMYQAKDAYNGADTATVHIAVNVTDQAIDYLEHTLVTLLENSSNQVG